MNLDVNQFGRVGVLMGGCSSEKKISIKSGEAVLKALKESGVTAMPVVIESENDAVNEEKIAGAGIDVAFIAMHGRYGEDGGIQTLLEKMVIPYAGSGPEASRRAINKAVTQQMLRRTGLPVADFIVVKREQLSSLPQLMKVFNNGPVVVKPVSQGSSIGVHIVHQPADLNGAVSDAFQYDQEILIEKFIHGRELTVGILADKALPVVEIRTKSEFFDYEAKYQKGMTEYIVPAELNPETAGTIQEAALKVFRVIGCRDFSRIDFLLSDCEQPYILEVNTIPGFTGTSLLPMAANCAGLDFQQLCLTLVGMALDRAAI
ncbi:MAG: D-alanine--D-alanine ligase [Candidatus Omnitrophota bacterium]